MALQDHSLLPGAAGVCLLCLSGCCPPLPSLTSHPFSAALWLPCRQTDQRCRVSVPTDVLEARTRLTKTLSGIITVTGDFGWHKCSTKDTKNAFKNNSSAQTVNNIYTVQIHTNSATPSPASSQDSWSYKRDKCATGVIRLRHLAASAAALCTQRKGKKNPKTRGKKKCRVSWQCLGPAAGLSLGHGRKKDNRAVCSPCWGM